MVHEPLMITCAIVGAELSRENTPYLPLTPDELATSAVEAVEAGASIIHLHVRDEQGQPSQSIEIFREVSEKIRQQCDAILQFSTGGAVGTPLTERLAPLTLKPEMATISMGTMNFGDGVFENTRPTIVAIGEALQQHRVLPELEIFDAGMLVTAQRLLQEDILPKRSHVEFVMGVPGGISGDLRSLLFLAEQLPETQTWSVAGIGRFQLPLSACAIAMGGACPHRF